MVTEVMSGVSGVSKGENVGGQHVEGLLRCLFPDWGEDYGTFTPNPDKSIDFM